MGAPAQKKESVTRSTSHLGLALARFRKLQNLTQKELSEKAGIDQAQLSRIETGKLKPETATLYQLTNALGLDVILRQREDSHE